MKPVILGIIVVLALVVTGYLFWGSPAAAPEAPTAKDMNLYANGTYGLSFSYPENYILSEQEAGPGHYAITLILEEDAVPVVNGEGPTAITFDIYDHKEGGTLSDWLTRQESNFQISDGTYASTTVGDVEAVHYGWSGLYEGETTAFMHEGKVIAASVTYRSPSDEIRNVYEAVLESLTLR
jgi:hypothetical protein